jgi:hypothetical protein
MRINALLFILVFILGCNNSKKNYDIKYRNINENTIKISLLPPIKKNGYLKFKYEIFNKSTYNAVINTASTSNQGFMSVIIMDSSGVPVVHHNYRLNINYGYFLYNKKFYTVVKPNSKVVKKFDTYLQDLNFPVSKRSENFIWEKDTFKMKLNKGKYSAFLNYRLLDYFLNGKKDFDLYKQLWHDVAKSDTIYFEIE